MRSEDETGEGTYAANGRARSPMIKPVFGWCWKWANHARRLLKRRLPTSSGDDERAVAGPKDLDADAQENEGRQAYDDIDAVVAQQGNRALGETVANIDREREGDDPRDGRSAEQRQLPSFERSGGPL